MRALFRVSGIVIGVILLGVAIGATWQACQLPKETTLLFTQRLLGSVLAATACAVLLGGAYMLPIIIAIARGHPNALPIGLLNVLLGWTFLFWVVALVWSTLSLEPADVAIGETRKI